MNVLIGNKNHSESSSAACKLNIGSRGRFQRIIIGLSTAEQSILNSQTLERLSTVFHSTGYVGQSSFLTLNSQTLERLSSLSLHWLCRAVLLPSRRPPIKVAKLIPNLRTHGRIYREIELSDTDYTCNPTFSKSIPQLSIAKAD
jgi:hypothetical protein